MLGINKIKKQLFHLTSEVDRRLPEAWNGVKDLRADGEKELERYNSLRAELAALKVSFAELVAEVQNPPKYKVGDICGKYTVVKVLPMSIKKKYTREYEALNKDLQTVMEVSEIVLDIWSK